MFQTLDGVVQAPMSPDEDRSKGFCHGAWAAPYMDDVMAQVGREAMNAPYDILFGRKTYDSFAAHWPSVQNDPVADRLNTARKYVASRSAPVLSWTNSTLISGDIAAEIATLKQQDGPLLQVHGSADLIQTLLAHDLVDEYRLWTFPVIAGTGKRFIEATTTPRRLALQKLEKTSNGVAMTIHRQH
jgi:dihydrofolate reductase